MKLIKIYISLFLILIFAFSVFPQKRKGLDEWLKIKVFISTRQDVEKIYDEKRSNGHFILYETPDGEAAVNYSVGDCKSTDFPIWNVPKWIVTEIYYNFEENPPKLKDLIPDKSKYKKKPEGDAGHIEYYNEETGVSIIYDEELKEVSGIVIGPSSRDKQKYDCNLIDNQ